MTSLEQLERWVAGESIHNEEKQECCPDFSCCRSVLASEQDRIIFRDAYVSGNQDLIDEMLIKFMCFL